MLILPIVLTASLFAGMASASVPLSWQVTPRSPAPVAFDRHHGETLEFRCTFAGFGELPFGAGGDVRLWYQTNGMGAAWWSVPASASSNVLSATFPPQADPGADRLSLFFGAPSNAYASAVLRLRPSPGFTPNVLPPPDVTGWEMDLAALRALIPPDVRTAPLELPEDAAARGVTFERPGAYGGTYENVAIEIGRGAKAALDAEAVSNAPNGQVLRSVSVAIGAEADATQGNPYTSQAVAIGWSAKAKTQNSVAIGSGSPEVHDPAEPTGNSTVAAGAQAVAIGYDAKAKGSRSIAVGRSAKALAANAVQLGTGTNATPDSLQFGDVTIVKDGKVQGGGGADTNAVRDIVAAEGYAKMKWTETNGTTRTRWTYYDAETDDDISFTAVVATNSDAEVGATLAGVEIYSKATVDRKLAEAQAGVVHDEDLLPLTNGIPALIDSAIAAIPKPAEGRSWNRPGEWSMAYVPTLETESADLSEISTNEAYMVFSNYTARTVRGLSANVFPERVDPLSIEAPLPVVLSVPDGGTVSGGVVSVPSNGLYRVRGVNTLGESREILVPFASDRIDERTVSVYVADKDGTARKLANDHAASVLAAMTDEGEAHYIEDTATFRVWSTISPTFAWPGVGNTTPFALSPHVMVTAAHYPTWNIDRWTSNTLTNWISGGTFFVRKGLSVHLADWAATNGFTAAEIALAGDLTDVAMIPLVEGEIPSECCPWLASVDWLAENYVNLEGICAWAITQGNAYWSPPANRNALLWAIPVILRGGSLTAANTWMAAGGIRPGMVARQDVADSIGQYNDRSWYEIRGGDSGKPVWICDFTSGARRDILISHFHTVGSGPNYAAALPILRAYCAAHGDTIKEIGND